MPAKREVIAWATLAAAQVLAHPRQVASELYLAETGTHQTAPEDFCGVSGGLVSDDWCHRALDRFLPQAHA